MSFHRHGGDQSINKKFQGHLELRFLFWVLNASFKHLSLACQTCSDLRKFCPRSWVTIQSNIRAYTSHLMELTQPTWGSEQLQAKGWQGSVKGWARLILQDSWPNSFPVSDMETAKHPGFSDGENCVCVYGTFLFFSIFSQSKTSLPQYFTWTRKI